MWPKLANHKRPYELRDSDAQSTFIDVQNACWNPESSSSDGKAAPLHVRRVSSQCLIVIDIFVCSRIAWMQIRHASSFILQLFEGVSDTTMSPVPATQMHATQAVHMFSLAFYESEKATTS